jgi:hypothetical protein
VIAQARGVLRFGGEGSGLLEVNEESPFASDAPLGPDITEVRIVSMLRSQLTDEQAELVHDKVPCILGHRRHEVVVLVPPRSIARVSGSLSDLRGKIRFGLARVGWEL